MGRQGEGDEIMGYIKSMYGDQDPRFIRGFLAAIDTYSVHLNGKRWIGSPEKEARSEMVEAVKELGDDPDVYLDEF